jgi:hypothetical protein
MAKVDPKTHGIPRNHASGIACTYEVRTFADRLSRATRRIDVPCLPINGPVLGPAGSLFL